MNKIKLVCFDLDDTLIYDIHSVAFPCILNGKYEEVCEIDRKETDGGVDWIKADHDKALLIKGLQICLLKENFNKLLKQIKNIKRTIDILHENGIKSILITAGPIQVAEVAAEQWGMDGCFGSLYEVKDGIFTGKIIEHVGDKGKPAYLKEFCSIYGYRLEDCIAVGDGYSDIPLFNHCGASIAINYSDSVIGKAQYYIKTDDLMDILQYII